MHITITGRLGSGKSTVAKLIVADHGFMQTTPDDHYLLFTLFKGYTYRCSC